MKKSASKISILFILVFPFMVSGCQNVVQHNQIDTQETAIPFSVGPQTPPSVKGPDIGLPTQAADQQTQAVTETDPITLTLPKTNG